MCHEDEDGCSKEEAIYALKDSIGILMLENEIQRRQIEDMQTHLGIKKTERVSMKGFDWTSTILFAFDQCESKSEFRNIFQVVLFNNYNEDAITEYLSKRGFCNDEIKAIMTNEWFKRIDW